MNQRAPAFIKIDRYKNVMELISMTKEKLAQAKIQLAKINETKKEEDAILATWETTLDDIDEKITQSDTALLEPEI